MTAAAERLEAGGAGRRSRRSGRQLELPYSSLPALAPPPGPGGPGRGSRGSQAQAASRSGQLNEAIRGLSFGPERTRGAGSAVPGRSPTRSPGGTFTRT